MRTRIREHVGLVILICGVLLLIVTALWSPFIDVSEATTHLGAQWILFQETIGYISLGSFLVLLGLYFIQD